MRIIYIPRRTVGNNNELELTWDDIANVPVADAYSVSDWNIFFNLPNYGTAFTSVEVAGNVVTLKGGSGITLISMLFDNNVNLIEVHDSGCVISVGVQCFNWCTSLIAIDLPLLVHAGQTSFFYCYQVQTFNFPLLRTAGDECFGYCYSANPIYCPILETTGMGCFDRCSSVSIFNFPLLTTVGHSCFTFCTSATVFNLASCVDLGTSVGYDYVFSYISGQTIALTVPTALMTCNGGDPDGDIQDLQANNTVTITQTGEGTGGENPPPATGDYYVSPTGNDSNSGTSALPFLTIQKAIDVANAGETVVLKDGVYSASSSIFVNITKTGTVGNPITFRSENKWGAVLDGLNICDYGIVIGNGASYINFMELEIKNFLLMGIFCNDGSFCHDILIQGNKIRDIGRVDDTQQFGRCAIYMRQGNHHWTINRNLMYNIGRTGPDSYYMNKDHAVYSGYADSLSSAAHHINITYNVVFGVSGNVLNLCSNNDLIANNVFAWSNTNSMGGSNFVTMDGPGVTNETIANNIFYQPTGGYAILTYAGYAGWSIKNNMVIDSDLLYQYDAGSMDGGNYGPDCENAEVDPQFVSAIKANAPNVDFRLQATSPAINAGVNVGLITDFLGNPITGNPDIGAFEY